MEGIIKLILVAAVTACLITYCNGCNKGEKENYASAKIEAQKSFEAEIAELRQQIKSINERHNVQITALQREQTSEINALERRNTLAINSLESEQTSGIEALRQNNANVIETKHSEFARELIAERDSSYLKGQRDARDSVQRQIDDRAQRNIANNDWNAPVFSTRR